MQRVLKPASEALPRGREAFGELAYAYLKSLIFDGALKPGQRVNLDLAMDSLQVSRQPVRDAINRLAHEGFILIVPQVGYFVATVSAAEVSDFCHVYSPFAGRLAAFAAKRGTELERGELRGIFNHMNDLVAGATSASWPAAAVRVRELDRDLHTVIHRMAKVPKLDGVADTLMERYDFYLASAAVPVLHTVRFGASDLDHERIVEAIVARDSVTAQRVMEHHIANAR